MRVEVDMGRFWPQAIPLDGVLEAGRVERFEALPLRPTRPGRQRRGSANGQYFALTPPRLLQGVRVERPVGKAWGLYEIRVFAEAVD